MAEDNVQNKIGVCGTASIWCNLELLKQFRTAVKEKGYALADEFNDFFRKRTSELNGTVTPNGAPSLEHEIEMVEKERDSACAEVKKRVAQLSEHLDFLKAKRFLGELGLKADLTNAEDIVPLFRAKWSGTDQSFKVDFVQLVKASAKKHALTKRLDELQGVQLKPGETENESDAVQRVTAIMPLPL